MAVITSGNFPKSLWPGVHAWFGANYSEETMEWPELFERMESSKAYEEDVETTSFGLAPVKPEGDSTSYDSHTQGYTKRYTHVAYGLGYIVTREERDDNLYRGKAFQRTEMLAFSMRQTKEIVAANVYNRAFNSSYVGGDSKELLATDHPSLAGNWSNELSPGADMSEAALEDLCIQIDGVKNSRGLKIKIMPEKLIIPYQLRFETARILKSVQQPGTANNDINALRELGMFKGGMSVNHYLTDPDAFFIRTNCPNGMTMFQRVAADMTQDGDFDTMNMKAKAYERYSFGWTDPRGLFGSSGA